MAKKTTKKKNITIEEKDFQNILNSLEQLENGKFNVSLKSKDKNIKPIIKKINKISKKLNSLNDNSNNMLKSLNDGNLDYRINSANYKGAFENITESMNTCLDIPIAVIRDFNNAISGLSHGNFDAKVSNTYSGEFGTIKNDLNSFGDTLQSLQNDSLIMNQAAAKGQLNVEVDTSKYVGDFSSIVEAMNKFALISKDAFNDAIFGLKALQAEYFDKRIETEY